MSKWTMEKIKSQIKRGDTCSMDGDLAENRLVLGFGQDKLLTHLEKSSALTEWTLLKINAYNFRFYRNGEEILPEPEREVIKFTEKLIDSSLKFMTESNRIVYQSNKTQYLSSKYCDSLVEEIPNARVLYRYSDTLEISHWGEK